MSSADEVIFTVYEKVKQKSTLVIDLFIPHAYIHTATIVQQYKKTVQLSLTKTKTTTYYIAALSLSTGNSTWFFSKSSLQHELN